MTQQPSGQTLRVLIVILTLVVEADMRTQNVVAVVAAVAAISIPTTQAQRRPGTPPTLFQPPNGSECPPSVGKNAPSSNEATGREVAR
jgi:hypothetical protein